MSKIICYTFGIETYAFSSPALNDCLKEKKKIKKSRLICFEIWLGGYLENGICVGIHKIPLTSLPNIFYCKGVYMGNISVYLKHQEKEYF